MPPTFPLDLKPYFAAGLRTDRENSINEPGLTNCLNLKPYTDGLRPIANLANPFSINFPPQDVEFPFPQVFKGKEGMFLLDKTTIYSVDEGFDITALLTYDANNLGAELAIVAGGAWHFIDMQNAWIFFNGNSIVFKDNLTFWGEQKIKVVNNISIATGCEFRGRLVTGGFLPGAVWKGVWKSIFDDYRDEIPAEFADLVFSVKENFVIWSTIGQSDMAFRWLLFPAEAQAGYTASSGFTGTETVIGPTEFADYPPTPSAHTIDNTLLAQMIQRNEFGIQPMPVSGRPLNIKAIGGEVSGIKGATIVYGEEGITALIPHNIEGNPTFGVRHLLNVGIAGRGAVSGDDYSHVFVDTTGCVWKLSSELEIVPLGYEEYFEGSTDWIVTHTASSREQEFFICNGEKGFTLTEQGLGQRSQLITSTISQAGKKYAVDINTAESEFFIETDSFDNKLSGIKVIKQIEISTNNATNILVAVKYKYAEAQEYEQTNWYPLNERGVATIIIAGTEFRVIIKQIDNTKNNKFKEGIVSWQTLDKRAVRGPDISSA